MVEMGFYKNLIFVTCEKCTIVYIFYIMKLKLQVVKYRAKSLLLYYSTAYIFIIKHIWLCLLKYDPFPREFNKQEMYHPPPPPIFF